MCTAWNCASVFTEEQFDGTAMLIIYTLTKDVDGADRTTQSRAPNKVSHSICIDPFPFAGESNTLYNT